MPFIHLSKTTEYIKMNLGVNYGLGVIMMCQCRFIDFNKGNAGVQDVNSGRGLALVAAGAIWKLCSFCSIAVNLKLLSSVKSI